MTDIERLTQTASQVRRDIVRMVTQAGSGHPGGSLSSTDFITALFFKIMKHSPEHWDRSGKGNDMFLLSAGHLSPLFYSVKSWPLSAISAPGFRDIPPPTTACPECTCPQALSDRACP